MVLSGSPLKAQAGRPASRVYPHAMDATKPYEFIGFGAMDVTKPYEFIRFGAMDATKPYEFIWFGAWVNRGPEARIYQPEPLDLTGATKCKKFGPKHPSPPLIQPPSTSHGSRLLGNGACPCRVAATTQMPRESKKKLVLFRTSWRLPELGRRVLLANPTVPCRQPILTDENESTGPDLQEASHT
jgi:hypothetical protein